MNSKKKKKKERGGLARSQSSEEFSVLVKEQGLDGKVYMNKKRTSWLLRRRKKKSTGRKQLWPKGKTPGAATTETGKKVRNRVRRNFLPRSGGTPAGGGARKSKGTCVWGGPKQ